MQSESNHDIINLIKLHVQVQLDEHLTYSAVSDVIIKKPLDGRLFENRMASVSKALFTSGFKVSIYACVGVWGVGVGVKLVN